MLLIILEPIFMASDMNEILIFEARPEIIKNYSCLMCSGLVLIEGPTSILGPNLQMVRFH